MDNSPEPPVLKEIDCAWLAGILEGEGAFTGNGGSLTIQVNMTDYDVVDRVGDLIGGTVRRCDKRDSKRKISYQCCVHGDTAVAVALQIIPYMSARRSKKIYERLNKRTATFNRLFKSIEPGNFCRYGHKIESWNDVYIQFIKKRNQTYYRCHQCALDRIREHHARNR